MVVLRCTRKLLDRLGPAANPKGGTSTTRLGDWYSNTLRLGRQQALIFISQRSRLPVLLPIGDSRRLSVAFPDAVAAALRRQGIPLAAITEELANLEVLSFDRTDSRSHLGTINDFSFGAQVSEERKPGRSLDEIAVWLAETPIIAIGGASPAELTRDSFGVPPRPRLRVV
jgi:hypothetical protein